MKKEPNKMNNFFNNRLIIFLVVVIITAVIARLFFFNIYRTTGNSMNNTLIDGDRLIVDIRARKNINHNDVVIFKDGPDELVKRCVGIAGDTLEIKHGNVYINSQEIQFPNTILKNRNNDTVSLPFDVMIFEQYNRYWDEDNFGPILIPFKGMKMKIDSANLFLYASVIRKEYEKKWTLKECFSNIRSKSIDIKNNYLFMLGDNRPYSTDSRSSIGIVSEKEVIGKTSLVLFSGSHLNRIFMKIR